MDSDKEARVRQRAYDIWVREGRPHGKDAEHWQKAEAEIASESSGGDRAAAGGKPLTGEPSIAPAVPDGDAAPLRSRRVAAKPARADRPATSESGAVGRRGRKTPQP